MYCPKCGQSQVSAEVRFCSRCGFPLVGVSDLLATGGMFPLRATSDESRAAKGISPRRRGVKQGAALFLFSILLVPFFGILHEATGFPGEFMVLGAFGMMAAIMRLIYAAFFEEGAPSPLFVPQPQNLYAPPRMNAAAPEMLPPAQPQQQQHQQQQQQQGVPAYRQPQVDTAQIMHPPSVTDHTTRLLEKQSDPSER